MVIRLLSEESVRAALNDFNNLRELLEKHPKGGEVGKKVRARAREVLTYMLSGGMIPTLTFYLAKGEESTIKLIKDAFEGKSARELEKITAERLAYAIIFYLSFKRLKQLGFVSSDLRNPRNCLRELIKINSVRRIYAFNLLTLYLLEFKKLCEATFEPER